MKKGFTLIELLAVIVVLAILAVIVTPIVLNIINNSKKGANLRSMESYAKVVQSAYMQEKLNNPNLTFEEFALNLSSYATGYDGNQVDCENVIIGENNSISLYNCTIDGNDNYCYVDGEAKSDCEFDLSSNININIGDIVYFDVSTGNSCTTYNEENSQTGYNGIDNKTGNQNSCLKFYQIGTNNEKINLILDHNIASNVNLDMGFYYQSDISFDNALTILKKLTDSWNGMLPQENYVDKSGRYVIEFSKAKARFISAEEVANIIGNKTFDEQKDNGNLTIAEKNSWLFDNIDSGYWTSTSVKNGDWCGGYATQMGDIPYAVYNDAWYVNNDSLSSYEHFCFSIDPNWDKIIKIGIRPVISINKDKLS